MEACAGALARAAHFCAVKVLAGEAADVLCALDILDGALLREVTERYGYSYRRAKSIVKSVARYAEEVAECGLDLRQVLGAVSRAAEGVLRGAPSGSSCPVCGAPAPPGAVSRHVYLAHAELVRQVAARALGELGVPAAALRGAGLGYGGGWWLSESYVEQLLPVVERAVADALSAARSRTLTVRARALARQVAREYRRERAVREATLQRVAAAARLFLLRVEEVVDSSGRRWVVAERGEGAESAVFRLSQEASAGRSQPSAPQRPR
jgi:hypothetical protein